LSHAPDSNRLRMKKPQGYGLGQISIGDSFRGDLARRSRGGFF
jgi:hypothetical protein